MKLHTHYMYASNRLRIQHMVHGGLEYDAYTRDVSPQVVALEMSFKTYLVRLGRWRDCMACSENWRKLKEVSDGN